MSEVVAFEDIKASRKEDELPNGNRRWITHFIVSRMKRCFPHRFSGALPQAAETLLIDAPAVATAADPGFLE